MNEGSSLLPSMITQLSVLVFREHIDRHYADRLNAWNQFRLPELVWAAYTSMVVVESYQTCKPLFLKWGIRGATHCYTQWKVKLWMKWKCFFKKCDLFPDYIFRIENSLHNIILYIQNELFASSRIWNGYKVIYDPQSLKATIDIDSGISPCYSVSEDIPPHHYDSSISTEFNDQLLHNPIQNESFIASMLLPCKQPSHQKASCISAQKISCTMHACT